MGIFFAVTQTQQFRYNICPNVSVAVWSGLAGNDPRPFGIYRSKAPTQVKCSTSPATWRIDQPFSDNQWIKVQGHWKQGGCIVCWWGWNDGHLLDRQCKMVQATLTNEALVDGGHTKVNESHVSRGNINNMGNSLCGVLRVLVMSVFWGWYNTTRGQKPVWGREGRRQANYWFWSKFWF